MWVKERVRAPAGDVTRVSAPGADKEPACDRRSRDVIVPGSERGWSGPVATSLPDGGGGGGGTGAAQSAVGAAASRPLRNPAEEASAEPPRFR